MPDRCFLRVLAAGLGLGTTQVGLRFVFCFSIGVSLLVWRNLSCHELNRCIASSSVFCAPRNESEMGKSWQVICCALLPVRGSEVTQSASCSARWRVASRKAVLTLCGDGFWIQIENGALVIQLLELGLKPELTRIKPGFRKGPFTQNSFLYIWKWRSCRVLGIWRLLNAFSIRLSPDSGVCELLRLLIYTVNSRALSNSQQKSCSVLQALN